jgi:peptidoglycan/LPS O-acetylase OafA/YrhL
MDFAPSPSLSCYCFILAIRHISCHTGILSPFNFGYIGVRIFFVISGFLITWLLLKELASDGTISLKNFYLRRTMRIFPCSYAYIATIALLGAYGVVELAPDDVARGLTYTINYGYLKRSWTVAHLWSLSVEEQFYLLWPAIVIIAGKRRATFAALATVALCPLIRLYIWVLVPQARHDIGFTFETVADALATGCLLACLRNWLWDQGWYRRLLHSKWVLLTPVLVLAGGMLYNRPRLYCLFGQTLLNVSAAVLIDWTVRYPQTRTGRFLNLRPMRHVGILSYSLYIWQQLFCVEYRYHGEWWSSFPVNVALSFAAAVLSFYLIEQPFLALRKKLGASAWFALPTRKRLLSGD